MDIHLYGLLCQEVWIFLRMLTSGMYLTHIIVMTQRGARKDFQKRLGRKGVEIVELDFLSPKAVADYCYELGFLSVLWECGGALAAPAITSGVIHKVSVCHPLLI